MSMCQQADRWWGLTSLIATSSPVWMLVPADQKVDQSAIQRRACGTAAVKLVQVLMPMQVLCPHLGRCLRTTRHLRTSRFSPSARAPQTFPCTCWNQQRAQQQLHRTYLPPQPVPASYPDVQGHPCRPICRHRSPSVRLAAAVLNSSCTEVVLLPAGAQAGTVS
jgi:hypothetical protein